MKICKNHLCCEKRRADLLYKQETGLNQQPGIKNALFEIVSELKSLFVLFDKSGF